MLDRERADDIAIEALNATASHLRRIVTLGSTALRQVSRYSSTWLDITESWRPSWSFNRSPPTEQEGAVITVSVAIEARVRMIAVPVEVALDSRRYCRAQLKACHKDLADPDLWPAPDGYPNSLALCMIDAIYSGASHHSSVVKVVGRYRDYRTSEGGNPDTDGTDELADTIRILGGPYAWATAIADHSPTTTDGDVPSKAAAIVTLSKLLPRHWVRTTAHLRSVAADQVGPQGDRTCLAGRARSGIGHDLGGRADTSPRFPEPTPNEWSSNT